MKTKDVGTITAYGYACDYGELDPREVSEREFGERLASYMTVAQEAGESADQAAQAANAAGQLYGQTATARDAAISAKEDAESAQAAAAEAANVAGRYESQAQTAKTEAESARDTAVNAVDGFAAGAQQALDSVNEAGANWKSLAEKQAGNSEAWAVGQRGGVDVPTTDATYHNNAKYYAEQAATDRTTAQTAATNAGQSATAAAESASAAAESARTLTIDATLTQSGQAADAKVVGDALETKAEIDGSYESMTVGNAEQLISSRYTVDTEPYLYRTSGGTADIGDREYDEIVGGSVVWNQLASFSSKDIPAERVGVTCTSDDSKAVILNGTTTGSYNAAGWFGLSENNAFNNNRVNHVMLFDTTEISGAKSGELRFSAPSSFNIAFNTIAIGDKVIFKVPSSTGSRRLALAIATGVTFTNYKFTMTLYDITQMLGSEIADYVYNLEQTTPGAGVAWFRKYFPNDYYEYNAGELKHVEGLSAHEMVGFNAFDPVTGTAKLVGGMQYQITGAYTALEIDGTAVTPDASGLFTPEKNSTLTVTGGNDTTCVHLTWSGWRNGEYEPYAKRSYPLDPSLTLRGIPKLSVDGKLYFDGDMYASDGTVTRRYALVDLGTLNWVKLNSYKYGTFSASMPNAVYNATIITFIHTSSYTSATNSSVSSDGDNYIWLRANVGTRLVVKDTAKADMTVEDFATSLSGVYLLYDLATPTTETALAYQSPQIVDDFGTEEYVSTGIVPVGHETKYLANLRDKIQHLPDLADSDGYYVIQQTGHDMSLIYFRIPQAPTTDGTYTLKATVTGGTPTYTWEEVTDNEG